MKLISLIALIVISQLNCMEHNNTPPWPEIKGSEAIENLELSGLEALGLHFTLNQHSDTLSPSPSEHTPQRNNQKEDVELASLFVILEKRISDDLPHEIDPYFNDILQKQTLLLSSFALQHSSDNTSHDSLNTNCLDEEGHEKHKDKKTVKRKRTSRKTKYSNKKKSGNVKQKPEKKQASICEYCKERFANNNSLKKHEYRKHANRFTEH